MLNLKLFKKCGFTNRVKVSYLKFQQLALFTIYPQMSCLGLNFLMSNIYFTRFLLQYHSRKKGKGFSLFLWILPTLLAVVHILQESSSNKKILYVSTSSHQIK